MATNSKYHRYREAGEEANVNNVAKFGQPVRSLFTSTKVFTMHHTITVMDANEVPVYTARTKMFTLHDSTEIFDANGNSVAKIRRKFFTLHHRHFIEMSDGFKFELSNEFWHIYKDITNMEGLGWQMRGNMFALNFELFDEHENPIAVISQKMFSIHDKYCVDIYKPEEEAKVVAILITLQHMIRDKEAAANNSSSSND